MATPTTAPVVGGEEGGRGAVVVDQAALVHSKEAEEIGTTSALGNHAEPGRDIFAGELGREARSDVVSKSKQAQEEPREEEEEKIFSTVRAPGGQEVTTSSPTSAEAEAETESPAATLGAEEEPTIAEDVSESPEVAVTDSSSVEEEEEEIKLGEVKEPQDPLDRDEAEAEAVRKQLSFPEETDI